MVKQPAVYILANLREKQIKGGSRDRKIQLVQQVNPEWKDLYVGLGL
ncbi:MAG: hypothetical protein KA155_09725 [Alphaproteobacteria bacterium]|jgi:predicted GIY-YIG superfamily endonuclease|nr:hypothetical protein [Alphaproteobacteria bacterium]